MHMGQKPSRTGLGNVLSYTILDMDRRLPSLRVKYAWKASRAVNRQESVMSCLTQFWTWIGVSGVR
jgi:hypothetical protein